MFFRNLTVNAQSSANATPGGATTSLTYFADVYMFNPNKSGCTKTSTGDTCYDKYTIGNVAAPYNQPLQDAINLSNTTLFLLQNNLISQFHSATTAEINNALSHTADGTKAGVSLGSLIQIQVSYGDALVLPVLGGLSLTNMNGVLQLNMGTVNVSVFQNQ